MTKNLLLKHLIAVAIIVSVGALGFCYLTKTASTQKAEAVAAAKIVSQDNLIKYETQTAVSALQEIYNGYKAGDFSLSQAKEFSASVLRDMRYGDNQEGYFFADTTEGVNVVLYGRTDVEGQNRNEAKDVNGLLYIQEIRKNGSQTGGGYTDYWFPKINETTAKAKRAFSLVFEPFGWVVGTGYYLEDVK
ncbi:MAG: cache domain-containing protein [Candidatus Uhrbacteria bacterium]